MAMAKKLKIDNIDENFIINSFRQDDTSISPEARSREVSTEEIPIEESQTPTTIQTLEQRKEEPIHRKKVNKPDYESLFVCESSVTARQGKQVYIRKDYHDRILKIIQVIGKNEVSIASYIDNVLTQHFDTYQSEITESYNQHLKSVF
jgi:hypothetical protein